jgi:cytochrome c553
MMKKIGLLSVIALLLSACGLLAPGRWAPGPEVVAPWGNQDFASNGERIYFTATNEQGEAIRYRGGPFQGMMMQPWLTCASCHGPDGRGGPHYMHMTLMDAPDIRYSALSGESEEHAGGMEGHGDEGYTLEMFKMAVVEGKHPDGEPLSSEMPRWKMSDQDLADLFEFLKTLP